MLLALVSKTSVSASSTTRAWYATYDLHVEPTVYKTGALTIELVARREVGSGCRVRGGDLLCVGQGLYL